MELVTYVILGILGSITGIGTPIFFKYCKKSNCESSYSDQKQTRKCRFSTETIENKNSKRNIDDKPKETQTTKQESTK